MARAKQPEGFDHGCATRDRVAGCALKKNFVERATRISPAHQGGGPAGLLRAGGGRKSLFFKAKSALSPAR